MDGAKQVACGIIDAMRFSSSRDYEFENDGDYFIAGPINCGKDAFDRCRHGILRRANLALADSTDIYAPDSNEKMHAAYMRQTISVISDNFGDECKAFVDAVVLLPGWEASREAVMAAMVAHECGIDLVLWEEEN